MPRAVRLAARPVSGDRRLGDDERVGLDGRRLAGHGGSDRRPSPSRHSRTHADGHRAAAGLRVPRAQRPVGGAVEEAAGDDRRRGEDRHVVARPRRGGARSRGRASRRGRRGRGRGGPSSRRAVQHVLDRGRRSPRPRRGAGRPAAARAGTRPGPVASRSPRSTSSAPRSTTSSAVASRPEPDVHPERGQAAARTSRAGRGSGRATAGARPAGTGHRGGRSRSTRVTRCPRSAATRAASSPAGPPPTTRTRRGVARPARTGRRPTRTRARPTG